jgi:BON domain
MIDPSLQRAVMRARAARRVLGVRDLDDRRRVRQIDVVDNDVTLTGTVASHAHRAAAPAAAAGAPGVDVVHDDLTVRPRQR